MTNRPAERGPSGTGGTAQVPAFALVSGGGDSTAAALWAEEDPGFAGVVYIDTGTALPGVREHVELLAARRGWSLTVLDSGAAYEKLVAKFGVPGPGFHMLPYRLLKERQLREFYREHGRVRLITGIRRNESVRRLRTTAKPAIARAVLAGEEEA